VFSQFLCGPGRQVALLSRKALEYDPYRQPYEKRLTRYLAWQWRNRQRRGAYLQPFNVNTLLAAVKKPVEPKHPGRTLQRLEKALETLYDDGVIAGWQYVDFEKPWQERKVLIEPPQEIMDHYTKIRLPAAKPLNVLPSGQRAGQSLSRRLREVRTTHGLTQLQLAEELDISPNYLAQIERGAKKPSDKLQTKIVKWLDQPLDR
jgi:DNA-binding XRE family transcriptional regulator